MTLKMQTKTIHYVLDSDLDNFVKEKFGWGFTFAADVESANDTAHEFTVDGQLDEYDGNKIALSAAGEPQNYMAGAILNYLAKFGHIPKGDYVIRVSW